MDLSRQDIQRLFSRYMSARRFLLPLAALLTAAAAPAPEWAFPGIGAETAAPEPPASDTVRLPGSPAIFHRSDFDGQNAIDWFPAAHPPAPRAVLHAQGGVYPCGYCHLPDGRGRSENARLQGLPADYIIEQVHAFATGARRAALPYLPTQLMAVAAHAIQPADLAAAAAYFSRFEPQSHTSVVEAATIPAATPWHFVYRFDPTHHEPLGQRIVEGPTDTNRSELRDPTTPTIAYVPSGAITRGRTIAEHGTPNTPPCTTCHGQTLVGIAGASPTYLARQLMDFRTKARNDPDAAPMQAVAGRMTGAQIIDAAAFVGSRRPWTGVEMRKMTSEESLPAASPRR